MKLLIVGDFEIGMLGHSYLSAFQKLGHKVEIFDINKNKINLEWAGQNRFLHRMTIKSMYLRNIWAERFNSELIKHATQAHVQWVFLLNGTWIMPETISTLKHGGIRVAIFHADNPFPPNYNNRPETIPSALEADLYLIWSKVLVSKLSQIGVKNVQFLPFGWDEEVHPYQGGLPQGQGWKGAIFIGSWDPEREVFLEKISAHIPLKIYGSEYWGSRTQRNSRARGCWTGKALKLSEAARALRESSIALNILRTQHVIDQRPDGVIMRHFEVPGSGGFLLSTRGGTATEIFKESEAGAYFSGYEECIAKCNYYLENEDERLMIVKQAHDLVVESYTYLDCATMVANYMNQC